jgi:hypothetical protein
VSYTRPPKPPDIDLENPPDTLRFPHFTKGRKDAKDKMVFPYCNAEMKLVPNEPPVEGETRPPHWTTYQCGLCGTKATFW